MTETIQLQLSSLPALVDLQSTCEDIKRIKLGDKPKNAKFGYVDMNEKEVFCETTSKPRPYVPLEMRSQIITSLHQLDHLGEKASVKRVAGDFYWPSLKYDVEQYVKKCDTCNKIKPNKRSVNTGDFRVPDTRFSHVMVDVVGPLPVSQGYRFLLTCICRSSRYFRAIPMKEASSEAAASAFMHGWLGLFGVPAKVTSDNGGSFSANLWRDMMNKFNIEVTYSPSYRPQAIGMLERQHRSLKNSLKAAIEDMGQKHQEKSGWRCAGP